MSLYRKIIRQAWQVSWRSKYLWFLGLFAALLGNGGEYELVFRGLSGNVDSNFFPTLRDLAETGVFSGKTLANIPRLLADDPLTMLLMFFIGGILLLLFGFLIWLVIVSQAGLVNNSALSIGKKKHDFPQGVAAGIKHFWQVLGLNTILRVVVAIAFAIISYPIILSAGQSNVVLANLIYGLGFLIFIPLVMMFSFVIKFAIAYAVIKDMKFNKALQSGWVLFSKNWLVSLEMALILFVINFAVGIALLFSFLILAVPFIFLALLFYSIASAVGFWLVVILAFIAFFVSIVIVGSWLASFQISAWTGLFLVLVSKGGLSKIARAMGKVVHN